MSANCWDAGSCSAHKAWPLPSESPTFTVPFERFPWTLHLSDQRSGRLSSFAHCRAFGSSIAHCCSSFRWAAFWHAEPCCWPQMVRSGRCSNCCKPPLRPHISCMKLLIRYCELRESCPWIWQISIHIDVPRIVNTAFLQHIQGRMGSPDHVNVFQGNWECVFFRHGELNSRFDVMTISEIPFDRPEISAGFCVISCFVYRLRLLKTSLKVSSEIFTWCKLVPHESEFSDSMLSSVQLDCTICDWEYEIITTLRRKYVLCIASSSMDFWHGLSKFTPRTMHVRGTVQVKLSYKNWWSLDWSFAEMEW